MIHHGTRALDDDFDEIDFTKSRHAEPAAPAAVAVEAPVVAETVAPVVAEPVASAPVVAMPAPEPVAAVPPPPVMLVAAAPEPKPTIAVFDEMPMSAFSRPFVSVADRGDAESTRTGELPSLLDPGFRLSLRPMRYPQFYERYRQAIANTWSVEEVDFTSDIVDLRERVTPAQRHVIQRLVAFFATGDTIVANNLVLSLYKHLNAPEARLYLSRQLFEEAQHIQFYLTLLDAYLPSDRDRVEAFTAVEHIPSIRRKAEFCFTWTDAVQMMERITNEDDARLFLRNLTAFAAGVEGLFFFGAFAYVYYLRSRGLFNGLATGTNWVFRDESMHMAFAFEAIEVIRQEQPHLFDSTFESDVHRMLEDAVACEYAFAEDLLGDGVAGLSLRDMDAYLKNVADRRLENLGYKPMYHAKNPFDFMELQDVQEVTNFFERRVSSYQVGVQGDVDLDEAF